MRCPSTQPHSTHAEDVPQAHDEGAGGGGDLEGGRAVDAGDTKERAVHEGQELRAGAAGMRDVYLESGVCAGRQVSPLLSVQRMLRIITTLRAT